MLFSKLFLALPFVGAVLASPVPKAIDSVAPAVEKRDVDILAIVTELKASVVSVNKPFTSPSAQHIPMPYPFV